MNDPRPKTEQPKEKEQTVPSEVREPSTTAAPTAPLVLGPQPKGPDSGGDTRHVADPKEPARPSTQAKP